MTFRFGLTACFPHAVFFNPKSFSSSFVIYFIYFCNIVAFNLNKKKKKKRYFPFAGSCVNFSVAFRKSCKDFYIMKSDGLYITNAIKPWFCYKQFIFVLYWTLLCNTTEISTIANWRLYSLLKGALLSQSYQTLSRVVTQSALQCMPAFTIWYSASNDNGKCYKKHGWQQAFLERLVQFILYLYSLNTRFENTAFHIWVIFLYSVTTYIS